MNLIYKWCNYWANKLYEKQYRNKDAYAIRDVIAFTIYLPLLLCIVGCARLYRKLNISITYNRDKLDDVRFTNE